MKQIAITLLMLLSVATARAQFDYPDFSGIAGLKLVGSAFATVNSIRLTPNTANKAGALWYKTRQLVRDGFATTFTFRMIAQGGMTDGVANGGDGIAFLIQNASDSAIGAAGGSIGYDGIPNSVAIEFDSWNDDFRTNGDPNGNHVSIQTRGRQPNSSDHGYSIAASTAIPYLKDGQPHRATIEYRNKLLSIYLDNCARPVLSTVLNLDSALKLDSGRAWFGFTAATASAWEIHELISWSSVSDGIIAGDSVTICEGDSVRLTVPTLNGSCVWSTGARGPSIKVGASGTYSVTVNEGLGCKPFTYTARTKVTAVALAEPAITHAGSLVLCSGDSITLDAGEVEGTYRWSNGATSRTITVGAAGDYWVEESNGICTKRSKPVTVVVLPSPKPVITPLGKTVLCAGDSVTLDAGDGYTIYNWSNGANTRIIRVGDSGTYSVEVFAVNGCRGVSPPFNVIIYRMPQPSIVPHGVPHLCQGDTLVLDASIGYDRYVWSTGDTGQSIVARTNGDYVVTVTSAEGCTGSSPPYRVRFNSPPKPIITASGPTRLCIGGSVTLTAPGGYGSYLWSTGSRAQSITVNATGSYTVTVSDSLGCSGASDPIEVTIGSSITPVITALGATEFCEGDSVMIAAQPGYASYQWSSGATEDTIVVKSSGTYDVHVFDAGGCNGTSASISVTVHQRPATPMISGSGGDLLASSAATYQWLFNGAPIAGATAQRLTPGSEGNYSVEVTDGFGCSARSASYSYTLSASAVSLGDLTAAPGELVRVPIVLDSSRNLDGAGARAFSATLRFRASLLVPVDPAVTSTFDGSDRLLTVTGERPAAVAAGRIGEVVLMAMLGDTDVTPLRLESFNWTDGNAPVVVADGAFHLTGICLEGGSRLVDASGNVGLKGVRPNPAGTTAEIEYAVIEAGRAQLYLVDALGRRVMTIIDGDIAAGTHTARIDVRALPTGLYLCVLETPTMRDGMKMVVVK